jgi:hypothetical protein
MVDRSGNQSRDDLSWKLLPAGLGPSDHQRSGAPVVLGRITVHYLEAGTVDAPQFLHQIGGVRKSCGAQNVDLRRWYADIFTVKNQIIDRITRTKSPIGCPAWPRLISQISGHGLVEQACSCLASFGSSRRTRMSFSESFADDRSVFSKLFRLSSIYFSPNQVILDRLQHYPDLIGYLGAQISFSQDSEEFFSFVTPL